MAEVDTVGTIEINDAIFCQHFKEVCTECGCDTREDNDAFFGLDPVDRDGLEAPASVSENGVWQCKKHRSTSCNVCYGWKKQIVRLQAVAKKADRA